MMVQRLFCRRHSAFIVEPASSHEGCLVPYAKSSTCWSIPLRTEALSAYFGLLIVSRIRLSASSFAIPFSRNEDASLASPSTNRQENCASWAKVGAALARAINNAGINRFMSVLPFNAGRIAYTRAGSLV